MSADDSANQTGVDDLNMSEVGELGHKATGDEESPIEHFDGSDEASL